MSKMGQVVVVCGFFDPIHYGHVDYMRRAKALADADGSGTLWVVVNSDKQASLKKGKAFMPAAERVKMVRSLGCVDAAMEAPDSDSSVCKALEMIHPDVFAIGLDEGPDYMKEEKDLCRKLGIQIVCPLGARIQSSTWLLDRAAENKQKQVADAAAADAAK